jgi:hypothetical protein
MANYQVLFDGQIAEDAKLEVVRANLARELGLDERKTKQLFSGRTVVIRSQLEQREAENWQQRLAALGAVFRVKNCASKAEMANYAVDTEQKAGETLRDITAAPLECPRCGHMQLDSSQCARCGVDLEQAYKQKHKEDLLIEKKIRDLRAKPTPSDNYVDEHDELPENKKKSMSGWLKR